MKKRSLLIVVGLFLVTAVAVWAEEKETPEMQSIPAANCPMMVDGVSVSYADTDGGAALIYATEKGDVKDLQARVAHMASMYNYHKVHGHSGMGPMMTGQGTASSQNMGGMHGAQGESMMGQDRSAMMLADAKVENTDRGARLILTPKNKEDLNQLREHAKWMAHHMSQGNCPKMQQRTTGVMGGSMMGGSSEDNSGNAK